MAAPGDQPIWFRVFPPEAEQDTPFHGAASGPIRMPARDSPPILYFYLLFSLDLIKEFVKQTNRYKFRKILFRDFFFLLLSFQRFLVSEPTEMFFAGKTIDYF